MIIRRPRRTIDDTLRLTLAAQRRTIADLSARLDQVQQQTDRQDTTLTEHGSRLADLEARLLAQRPEPTR